MAFRISERLELARSVTPKPLVTKPIHRWYVFPHSFTTELVHSLIDGWSLTKADRILDPFVGAGTTLLAAKEKGIPAVGYDLSPLAVLASRVKVSNYQLARLKAAWQMLSRLVRPSPRNGMSRTYPILVRRALPGRLLGAFDAIARNIEQLPYSAAERAFFMTALLKTIPKYSRAQASGGWLEWVDNRTTSLSLPSALAEQVAIMFRDLDEQRVARQRGWTVGLADARNLPDQKPSYSAVITSPPYPNRHDYTRVFGIELMFGFLDWAEARRLRYQSLHSHPEGRPRRPASPDYVVPERLARSIRRIEKESADPRVPRMLSGYFVDMHLCLKEMRRVSLPTVTMGLVLGNAQYCGETIRVDELTAEIAERLGLKCEEIRVTRYRGNSAQQMGQYGRKPSRESIVILRGGGPKRRGVRVRSV